MIFKSLSERISFIRLYLRALFHITIPQTDEYFLRENDSDYGLGLILRSSCRKQLRLKLASCHEYDTS
jgi:hypothetical protein